MHATVKPLVDRAQAMVDRARDEGRGLSHDERREIEDLLDQASVNKRVAEMGAAMSGAPPVAATTTVGGLWGAMEAQRFDRKEHPFATVDLQAALYGASASFDGTIGTDTLPQVVPAPSLGADRRFLYAAFPTVAVPPDVANVSSYRQKARTLAAAETMVRAIDAVTTKPETSTQSEVTALTLSQVANVSTAIPDILFASTEFRSWVQNDLELGWRHAIDYVIDSAITAAVPPTYTGSAANAYEAVVFAREAVRAAGYQPDVVVVSPADALSIQLLQLTGGTTYAFTQPLPAMVVSPTLADGGGFVADAAAAGTLYASAARFEVFVENAGQTNTWTARYESHAGFQIHRVDAICALDTAS